MIWKFLKIIMQNCHRQDEPLEHFNLQDWLDTQDPYDVIVDGANVAFFGQSFEQGQFQFSQIGDVVETICAEMPGSRPLVVTSLNDAHLQVTRLW